MRLSARRAAALSAIAFAVASAPAAAAAQARLGGQWTVRYTRVSRNMHTGVTTVVEETAQMILRPRGDSVFGFWQWPSNPGEPPLVPRTVRGVAHGDSARVQVDPAPNDDEGFWSTLGREIVEFIKTHVHNMPSTIPLLEFAVRGDSLVGTRRTMTLDGTPMSAPRLFIGVRERKTF